MSIKSSLSINLTNTTFNTAVLNVVFTYAAQHEL